MENTDTTKKTYKKERKWIRGQKFIKKKSDGEIKAYIDPEDLSMSTASLVTYGHKGSYKAENEPCLSNKDWLLVFVMGNMMKFPPGD